MDPSSPTNTLHTDRQIHTCTYIHTPAILIDPSSPTNTLPALISL